MKRLLVFLLALTFLFSLSVSAAENGENKYVKVWDSTLDDVPEGLWDIHYMGDMDGDDLREFLVCTDEGGAILYLYECTGDNSYAQVWTYAISGDYCADSYILSKGDLDGDELEEIIAGVSTTGGADHYGIHIFEWDGVVGSDNYVFQTMYNPMVGDAGSITIAGTGDFDGDGVQELFLGETRNDDIYIVSLDTLSDFSFPTWNVEFTDLLNDEADYSLWGFTWGDFDNDGQNEIVCTEWDYNALIVIQADSANSYHRELWWDDMTHPSDGAALRSLCSDDLNGDGFTEIILPSTDGNLYIIQNFGTFDSLDIVAGALDSVTSVYDIVGADFGDQDMYFGNVDEPDVYIAGWYGIYDLEFTGTDFTSGTDWDVYHIAGDPDSLVKWQDCIVGDFDSDGLKDIAYCIVSGGSPYIEVYEHEPLVRADVTTTIAKDSSEYFYQMRGICAGSDIDLDGKKEIFVTDYRCGGIHGFEVVGDNTIEWIWSTPDTMQGYAPVRGVTTGDLDNDGIGEVIFPVRMAGADDGFGLCLYEWDGTTDNGFNIKATSVIDDSLKTDRWRTERVTVADVDGDGVNELLYANNGSDHTKGDRFYIISFDGSFESGFYTSTIEASWNQTDDEFNGSPWYADYGDLDGDGTYEVIFAAWDHGGLFIVDVTAADTYEKANYILADPSLTDGVAYGGVAIADFDGDGRDEVISPMYSNYLTSILNIDGTIADATAENSVGTIRGPWLGAGIGMSAAADMNGDGKAEFYGANYSTHCYEFSYTGSDVMDPGSWTVKSVISEIEEKTALGFYAVAAVGPGEFADDLDGDGKGEVLVGYLESFDFDPEIWFKVAEYTEGVFVEQDWKVITPKDYKLSQNYPNPFNPNTQINFELPLAKDVTLTIYDMLGREVITLVNEHKTAGKYTVNWDGKNRFGNNTSAGVYIYQLKAGHIVKNKTMTLLK